MKGGERKKMKNKGIEEENEFRIDGGKEQRKIEEGRK